MTTRFRLPFEKQGADIERSTVSDAGWKIEPIRKAHLRDLFDCGVADLNDFIWRFARQSEEIGIARTFVAIRPGDLHVAGYYTLRSGSVVFTDWSREETRRFPKYPIPVVHLARLAVDRAVQGQGLGSFLLVDALRRAHAGAKEIAAYAVELLAPDERARSFYLKYGFKSFPDNPHHLYLSMKAIDQFVRSLP